MAWEPQAVTKAVHANGQPVTWADLRLEYIMGNMTLRELSEKHGVSMSTLTKRSAKEGWEVARKQQAERVIEAAQQAAIDQRAKALAEFNEADLRVARALRAMVARRLNEAQEKKTNIPPKDLGALGAWRVHGQPRAWWAGRRWPGARDERPHRELPRRS